MKTAFFLNKCFYYDKLETICLFCLLQFQYLIMN